MTVHDVINISDTYLESFSKSITDWKNHSVDCFENEERASFEHCIIASKGKTAGADRVLMGIAINFADIYKFLEYCQIFVDRTAPQ